MRSAGGEQGVPVWAVGMSVYFECAWPVCMFCESVLWFL